jgi:hypothetical protein
MVALCVPGNIDLMDFRPAAKNLVILGHYGLQLNDFKNNFKIPE